MQSSKPESVSAFAERPARERMRIIKDRLFAACMAIGGIAVIVSILLIFLYLFYVVLPLFKAAELESVGVIEAPGRTDSVYAIDEYAEIGLRADSAGRYQFFALDDGHSLLEGQLGGAGGALLVAGAPSSRSLFLATQTGGVLVALAEYAISYPQDKRVVTPSVRYPLGADAISVDDRGQALRLVAGEWNDEQTTLAAVTADGRVVVVGLEQETSMFDDEVTVTARRGELDLNGSNITHLAIDIDQRELFLVTNDGALLLYNIINPATPVLVDRTNVVSNNAQVTALAFLSGGISVLIGDSDGRIAQWFPVRDENNNYALAKVREFEPLTSTIVRIAPEHYRKAFAAIDSDGHIGLYHTTAGKRLLVHQSEQRNAVALVMSPRADAALAVGGSGQVERLAIDNEHPEVSAQALWGEVWYESRDKPEYIWQSSSASSAFEPKFSLTPLTFGTFKATFYSMLFAIPLAVFGAIYTAYFMTPKLRNIVKPSIEVMAALPTVILGFLAGLWLAPLLERELLGLSLALLLVPLAVVGSAWLWSRLPSRTREAVPGWEAVMLIPLICLATWFSIELGSMLEVLWFGGSLPHWLNTEYGISYDQRNSLVVGIAIGFAVIPTIFSISEDAVFSVPRSLTMGSLALGATPWQTALRVVLLTASPGIFSAVMIGMGRAVGETMIVLMATGNTPIMDLNIFEGFRALSANIAVEMPESEVGSTHYRVLFLAALVLFLVTFAVNTVAELVRQRLRRKYASL